jgi:hypothetical protein
MSTAMGGRSVPRTARLRLARIENRCTDAQPLDALGAAGKFALV